MLNMEGVNYGETQESIKRGAEKRKEVREQEWLPARITTRENRKRHTNEGEGIEERTSIGMGGGEEK